MLSSILLSSFRVGSLFLSTSLVVSIALPDAVAIAAPKKDKGPSEESSQAAPLPEVPELPDLSEPSSPQPLLDVLPLQEEWPGLSLPAPEELFQNSVTQEENPDDPLTAESFLCVSGFTVSGDVTAFSPEHLEEIARRSVFPNDSAELEASQSGASDNASAPESCLISTQDQVVQGYLLTLADIFQARAAVTQYYVDEGYSTSGAFIPEQALQEGLVEIRVLEGAIESINVSGNERLDPAYVTSRIGLATAPPLNQQQLLDALRLLQQDQLIESVSARLSTGTQSGSNILNVEIQEADPFYVDLGLNNDRPAAIGTFSRDLSITHQNLLGIGDRVILGLRNTDGGTNINFNYSIPVSPHDGTLNFGFETASNAIIQPEFEILGIRSSSSSYNLSFRQPVHRTPSEEFAVGLGVTLRQSQLTFDFLGEELPLASFGSDSEGNTRVLALRLTQDWTQRGVRQVFAARSQLNIGLGAFGSTVNANPPDSRFVSWVGQAQWIYLLERDTPLVLRGSLQFADRPLVPMEQIAIGGRQTVRGYSQNALTSDNGGIASAEVRLPIYRNESIRGVLQLIPFVDFGAGWNSDRSNTSYNTLLGAGVGLGWQQSDTLSARFDWGIPLINLQEFNSSSLQDSGFYFSIQVSPF